MKTLHIRVEFLSDWLCGSGLSFGNEVDLLPIKYDKTQLPYIPGKTFKGLIREQLELLNKLDDKTVSFEEITKGIQINGNLDLEEDIPLDLVPFLYRNIASTKINEKGVAEEKSLRVKQVVMPLTLVGVLEYDQEIISEERLENALKLIRCLGEARNKGLGRCRVTIQKNK